MKHGETIPARTGRRLSAVFAFSLLVLDLPYSYCQRIVVPVIHQRFTAVEDADFNRIHAAFRWLPLQAIRAFLASREVLRRPDSLPHLGTGSIVDFKINNAIGQSASAVGHSGSDRGC